MWTCVDDSRARRARRRPRRERLVHDHLAKGELAGARGRAGALVQVRRSGGAAAHRARARVRRARARARRPGARPCGAAPAGRNQPRAGSRGADACGPVHSRCVAGDALAEWQQRPAEQRDQPGAL